MKDSEKKLMMALGTLLLAAAVLILFKFYQDRKSALETERLDLEGRVAEIEELLVEREMWAARADWLDKYQPAFATREDVDKLIFRDANAEGVPGVTTSDVKLMEGSETEHYIQAGASLTAKGSLEDVFRWLHDLQEPEEFRVISNLVVTPDKDDDSRIVCKFDLLRWYAPL